MWLLLLLLLFLFAPSVGAVTTPTVDGIRRSKATTNHGVCGGGGMLRFVSIRVLSVVCVCWQEQWVVRSIDQSFERETTRCFVALLSRARNQTGAPVTLESGVAWQWDKPDVLVLTLRILQPFGSSLRLVEQWREHALSLSLSLWALLRTWTVNVGVMRYSPFSLTLFMCVFVCAALRFCFGYQSL